MCTHSLFSVLMVVGDLKGAVQTLRALLLFYPKDTVSLSNLQLYSESLEGDPEAQAAGPSQVGVLRDDVNANSKGKVFKRGFLFEMCKPSHVKQAVRLSHQ